MKPLISTKEFIESEFSNLNFKDLRLSKRIKRIAYFMNESPNLSFPNMTAGKKDELKGLYRFFQNPKVNYPAILETHYKNTIERCLECRNEILLITDTVYVEPLKYPMFEGLQSRSKNNEDFNKIRVHYMIAVDSKSKQVLGITDFLILKGKEVNGEIIDRQSMLWEMVLENTIFKIRKNVNSNHLIEKLVFVADREADDLGIFFKAKELGINFVVRGKYDRTLNCELNERMSDLAGKEIKHGDPYEINVLEGNKKRKATVQRYIYPEVYPHSFHRKIKKYKDSIYDEVSLGIVVVAETDPPNGSKPVHWFLLTSLPYSQNNLSEKVVSIYKSRWIIEELNKCAKTGVSLEDRQFTDFDHMAPAMAITFIIAWRILTLRTISEKDEKRSIEDFFVKDELKFLKKNLDLDNLPNTLGNALTFIATLGGYLGNYDKPGWIVLWRGWIKFSLMSYGYAFYAKHEVGENI